MNIKFVEYNGIEGYIELMKHDVEPLNNPDCKRIELYYDGKDIKALLDYITNLQEENERLKELNENASKVCMAEHRYGVDKAEEARDYKSRCEKAIEYIDNNSHYYSTDTHEEGFVIDTEDEEFCNSLLNILTGGDKE